MTLRTPPKRPADPNPADPVDVWRWMDEIDTYYMLLGLYELREEQQVSRTKIVRLLQDRSRQLADRERRRRAIRLVYDRDADNTR